MKRRTPQRARCFAALLPVLCACCEPDDIVPADVVVDVSPDIAPEATVDASEVGADSGADATDATEASVDAAPVITRCDWPDGGPPMAAVMRGGNTTTALCNFCHIESLPGVGLWSGQTTPRPRTMAYGANLTPDPTTGIGMRTDEQFLRAVRTGIAADGRRRLCEMVPFEADRLSDEDLCGVLAYLRSIPPVRRMIPASTCPSR